MLHFSRDTGPASAVLVPGLARCGTCLQQARDECRNEITIDYQGDADGDGNFLFVIGIEDEIVEPVESTTCVTGIGLGANNVSLPAGTQAVAAHIDRVNRTTGEAIRLEYFRFAADAETSVGMAQGGGSGVADPRPIVDGASWFGFSSAVDPFVLETGPDEYIRMTFEVLVPGTALPMLTDIQFASGEGMADGTPIFTGDHPVEYYAGSSTSATLDKFQINAGLNDAWFNPATAGQGLLIAVFPDAASMFIAWFTFDLERPGEGVEAQLGDPATDGSLPRAVMLTTRPFWISGWSAEGYSTHRCHRFPATGMAP